MKLLFQAITLLKMTTFLQGPMDSNHLLLKLVLVPLTLDALIAKVQDAKINAQLKNGVKKKVEEFLETFV